MFRNYKQQTPRKVSRKKPLPDDQNDALVPAIKQHPTLQMQSLIGNHATQRMIIQRMPTHGSILGTLGQPKAHKTIMGKVIKQNSTKYRAVLDAVKAYDLYISGTVMAADKTGKQNQFQHALNLLSTVSTTIGGYDGKTDVKAQYFARMKPQVEQEKNKVAVSMIRVINKPVDYSLTGQPKLITVIKADTPVSLRSSDAVGGERGGSSEVTKMGGSKQGFFKENKETLADWDDDSGPGETFAKVSAGKNEEDATHATNAALNEKNIGVDLVGIDAANAQMAKRDVAMSRLNQLLGADVIAKAELAVMHGGGGKKEGSLMEDASKKGKSAFSTKFHDEAKGDAKATPDSTSLQDPELMRQLSRLQLIDLLAFQVDRNTKNYYIQTDPTGKVLGIVGIDNDFSLGTNVNIEGRNQQLPGISRFVDEDLANAIINLDAEVLKSLMYDLLSEAEIAALVTRLQKLQAFLLPLKNGNQLLKPNQWTPAIAQQLLDEKMPGKSVAKSYYSQLVDKVKGGRAV